MVYSTYVAACEFTVCFITVKQFDLVLITVFSEYLYPHESPHREQVLCKLHNVTAFSHITDISFSYK